MAGEIVEPRTPALAVGTEVIAHGYDLGVAHHGGYTEYAARPGAVARAAAGGLDAAAGDGGRDGRVHGGAVGVTRSSDTGLSRRTGRSW